MKHSDSPLSTTRQIIVGELHKPARVKFPRRHTEIRDINETLQMDLVEMNPYSRSNRGFKYILTIIDIFSKFAWALPLKNKSAIEVHKVLAKFFKTTIHTRGEGRGRVENVQTDGGKEFFNSTCSKLFASLHINHYCTYTVLKAAIVERFNRTIKNKIWKHFSLIGKYKWIDDLPRLMDEYNNSRHRITKFAPATVNESNKDQVLRNILTEYTRKSIPPNTAPTRNLFKVGDYVRISKHKAPTFSKGYTPNWSAEIFKIVKRNNTTPYTYMLQDETGNVINGSFYSQELQITRFPDTFLIEKVVRKDPRRKRVLVKWFDIPHAKNSWIPEEDLIPK
jgi:hypothetical protein